MFDGHAGFSAAKYLTENLYEVFSEAINEGLYGTDCNFEGRQKNLNSLVFKKSKVATERLLQLLLLLALRASHCHAFIATERYS